MKLRNCYLSSLSIIVIIFYLTTFYQSPDDVEIPLLYKDKLIHGIMFYGMVCALSFDYELKHGWRMIQRAVLVRFFGCAVLYGGIIELIQLCFFAHRSGDWLDFVADCVGALVGCLLYNYLFSPFFAWMASKAAASR